MNIGSRLSTKLSSTQLTYLHFVCAWEGGPTHSISYSLLLFKTRQTMLSTTMSGFIALFVASYKFIGVDARQKMKTELWLNRMIAILNAGRTVRIIFILQ